MSLPGLPGRAAALNVSAADKHNDQKTALLLGAGGSVNGIGGAANATAVAGTGAFGGGAAGTGVGGPVLVAGGGGAGAGALKRDKPASKIVAKLSGLGNRFTGFEEQLSLQNAKKKTEDDKRIVALQKQIDALQTTIALEQRNRATSVKALQNWLEERMARWTERIEAPVLAKLEALDRKVEAVAARIEVIHKSHLADIESFPKRIDARAAELLADIRQFKVVEEQNQRTREERENKIAAKVVDSHATLQRQLEADRKWHEARVAELRLELLAETKARTIGYDLVKQKLDTELVTIKAAAAKEQAEREHADEELVQALNHYTAALQDGIKIVSENK